MEWNNHRITVLESSFLQSHRIALLETTISHANFNMFLPSIAEYNKLPIEYARAAHVSSPPYHHQYVPSHVPVLQTNVASSMLPEDVFHCGLPPSLNTVKEPGTDLPLMYPEEGFRPVLLLQVD